MLSLKLWLVPLVLVLWCVFHRFERARQRQHGAASTPCSSFGPWLHVRPTRKDVGCNQLIEGTLKHLDSWRLVHPHEQKQALTARTGTLPTTSSLGLSWRRGQPTATCRHHAGDHLILNFKICGVLVAKACLAAPKMKPLARKPSHPHGPTGALPGRQIRQVAAE